MKADKNFRLNQQTKRTMATIVDKHARGEYKRLMIQSQLLEEAAKRAALKSNDKNDKAE